MGVRYRKFSVFLFLLAASCVSNPSSENAVKFGNATNAALSTLLDAERLQAELLLKTERQAQSCKYLRGSRYELASVPTAEKFEVIEEQAKFLRALSAYATAMIEVTDDKGLSELKEASSGLADAVGKLAANLPGIGGATSSVVGPVTKVVLNGIVNFSEIQRRSEIREIAKHTHDFIIDGAVFVANDELRISNALTHQLHNWERSSRCALSATRSSRGAAHGIFFDIDAEKRNYVARIFTLGDGPKLMGHIIKVHGTLFNEKVDFDDALDEFIAAVNELNELKTAIESN